MSRKRIGRRDALRMLGAGGITAGLTSNVKILAWGPQQSGPAPGPPQQADPIHIPYPIPIPKILLIFLRGGWDSLNVLVPSGPDAITNGTYAAFKGFRPDVHIWGQTDTDPMAPANLNHRAQTLTGPSGTALFGELNPALWELLPVYAAGDLACAHRIAFLEQTRSHFSDQHSVEVGNPGDLTYLRGWPTRWAGLTSLNFPAASVSREQQRWFDTDFDSEVQAHIAHLQGSGSKLDYSFHEVAGQSTSFEDDLVAGLQAQAALPGAGGPPLNGYFDTRSRTLVDKTIASETAVANLVANGYTPAPGANYPVSGSGGPDPWNLPGGGFVTTFGNQLKDAAAILKHTQARIVGVEIGGWDTHQNQVDGTPTHAFGLQQQRLAALGAGMRAVYEDFKNHAAVDLLTMTFTEFGRTTTQNNTLGTDHANGNLSLIMGNTIRQNTQIYNFDASNFTPGDLTNLGPAWMGGVSDFRVLVEEALQDHMNFNGNIDNILEGYSADKAAGPASYYQQLNFT